MSFIICCAELSNRAAIKLQFLVVHHRVGDVPVLPSLASARTFNTGTPSVHGEYLVPVTDQRVPPLAMVMIDGGCDR